MSNEKTPLSKSLQEKLGTRLVLAFPYFSQYLPPQGFLDEDHACHALFYYALLARKNWEEYIKHSPVEYEGELTQQVNFRGLFNSISELYGEPTEKMIRFWSAVDLTFDAIGIPRLPDEERYRFNKPFEVISSK